MTPTARALYLCEAAKHAIGMNGGSPSDLVMLREQLSADLGHPIDCFPADALALARVALAEADAVLESITPVRGWNGVLVERVKP